jgi:uncharacterized membrane protein
MAALIPVALRQIGVVEHLPDPAGEVWDSDGIVMSKAAHPFGIPDAVAGLASYAITVTMLATGNRMLRPKLVCDASMAAFNVVRQMVSFGKVCSWCMGAAVSTAVMVGYGWRGSRETS